MRVIQLILCLTMVYCSQACLDLGSGGSDTRVETCVDPLPPPPQGPKNRIFGADGFDQDGIDREGYDRDGFGADGFSKAGLDLFSYNKFGCKVGADGQSRNRESYNCVTGFNLEGITTYGFAYAGQTRLNAGMPNESIAGIAEDGDPVTQALRYGPYGRDALGYARTLPHSSPAQVLDSRFDKDGYNEKQRNFLGILRTDFAQFGYDAIVRNNLVTEEGDDLVRRFNRDCWVIPDLVFFNVDGIQKFELLKDTAKDVAEFNNITDDKLAGFLKKSIVFCNFLKAGGLDITRPLGTLSVRTGTSLSDRLQQVNYQRLYEDWMNAKPREVKAQILVAFSNEVLDQAQFQDPNDEGSNKRRAVGDTLFAYDTGIGAIGGQTLWKGRYQNYKIAESIGSPLTAPQLPFVASYFMHGGNHCPDAKRKAIETAYFMVNEADFQRMSKYQNQLQGNGLEAQIKTFLTQQKSRFFSSWIERLIHARGEDYASTFSATWDSYAAEIGLENVGSAYPSFMIVIPNFIQDFLSPTGGNYTSLNIYDEFNKIDIMVDIRQQILGPLTSIHVFQPADGFPWVNGVLLRFGVLE